MGLPGSILDIPGSFVMHGTRILSIYGSMELHACMVGVPRTILGIPGYLVSRINGTACLVGVPGTVLGIPGYLVPCGQSGTSWICDTGVSYVSRDVQSRWAVLDIVELGKCCKIKGNTVIGT